MCAVVLTPTVSECGAGGVWTVKSLSGFVSPPPGGQVASDGGRPWTPEAPCLLEFQLSAGQRLNVTLLDFASRGGADVTSHVTLRGAETGQSLSSSSDTRRVSLRSIQSGGTGAIKQAGARTPQGSNYSPRRPRSAGAERSRGPWEKRNFSTSP